jgi:site-specific recombinase XerD
MTTLPTLAATPTVSRELSADRALELVFGNYAPNTRRAYARAFRDFQRWANIQTPQQLEQLDSLQMLEYKEFLKQAGKKPASINQSMSALKKVCKVLTECGYLQQNPFKSSLIRNERVSQLSNKGALRVNQLQQMLAANDHVAYDERIDVPLRSRNRALLKFLYFTAARRSEVAGLRWEHIRQDGRFWVAVLEHTKSGVVQKLKIREELYQDLQTWRAVAQEWEITAPWVFPSLGHRTMGQQMTGKGINEVVKRLGKEIGIEISTHYLRHTAITLALELGEPLQKVQAYARHASANTTVRYFHDHQLLEKNPTDTLPAL